MEKQTGLSRSILVVALATVLILMAPLIAMQFTSEVDWNLADFIIMGFLLFGAGLAYVLLARYATHFFYKTAIALSVGATLFIIWANLAVGLIGSGPNPGNLMYIGVVAVVIIGIFISRFSAGGMERVMYASAFALLLVAVIALLANMDEYPGSSVMQIIGVNLFFAAPYVVAGLLFRHAAMEQSKT